MEINNFKHDKPRILKQDGRRITVQDRTGKIRTTEIDTAGIKRGDFIQPDQKDEFMKTYGYHPDESKRDVEKFLEKQGLSKKPFKDFGETNDNRGS